MPALITAAVLVPVALVVAAVFSLLWRARATRQDSRTALFAGAVLAAWAALVTALARQGVLEPGTPEGLSPVVLALGGALAGLATGLAASPGLRRLLASQEGLVWLHLWRFEGLLFLVLLARGEVPALWAVPAGVGDVLVAAAAPWVARRLGSPGGRRRALTWNLLGLLDLILAVGLGVATSPGPGQLFHTTPTSALVTRYPLVLVPAFLVPLAFMLHVASVWQLLRGSWARPPGPVASNHRRGNPLARAAAGSAAFFLLAPGLVAGLVPWWLTGWQATEPAWPWPLRLMGGLLVLSGTTLLVVCFARFALEGAGTPAPVAPTERLVIGGPYRHVRNPMYLSVLAIICGQALWLGQRGLLAYGLAVLAAVASFVHWYEEPTLQARYGSAYEAYRRAVPGWWPRRRPWGGAVGRRG